MNSQRLLILAFAAALTAGTAAATPFLSVSVGPAGGGSSQSVSLVIDGIQAGAYSGAGNGSPIINIANDTWTDGWHTFDVTYDSISGTSGLTILLNGASWMPLVDLATYDATGTTINGLTGAYYTLNGTHQPTTLFFTDYGEGPLHYVGNTAPWSGTHNGYTFTTTSAFEEDLTGYVYFGAGTPSLSDVPPEQQSGGTAPEPASWWLMAAALPLMLFSKLRLRHAKNRE